MNYRQKINKYKINFFYKISLCVNNRSRKKLIT